MSSLVLCRLCQTNAAVNNCLSIASKRCRQQNWATRTEELLKVKVTVDDGGLPNYCCMKCCRRVEGLEKAARDLELFRELANQSYNELRLSHKRTKETSTVLVTPDTARARPPAKKYHNCTVGCLISVGCRLLGKRQLVNHTVMCSMHAFTVATHRRAECCGAQSEDYLSLRTDTELFQESDTGTLLYDCVHHNFIS